MSNVNLKMQFVKLKKSNKKAGFTLIELVAVMAIIAVLSVTFIPKFSNYITEAKKVAVLNQAKSVVAAYESVSYKLNESEENISIEDLSKEGMPLKDVVIDKINPDFKVSQCRNILNTEKYTFTLDDNGKAEEPTPTSTATPTTIE